MLDAPPALFAADRLAWRLRNSNPTLPEASDAAIRRACAAPVVHVLDPASRAARPLSSTTGSTGGRSPTAAVRVACASSASCTGPSSTASAAHAGAGIRPTRWWRRRAALRDGA